MTDLWKQILDNLAFVGVSLAIVVGLALLARLAEHFLPEKRKVSPARRVSIIGISAAIAAVLHVLDFPLVILAPEFYKLAFSCLAAHWLLLRSSRSAARALLTCCWRSLS